VYSVLEELTARFKGVVAELGEPNYRINSFASKGPIVVAWRNGPPWIVVDLKTEGYPSRRFVGKYLLTGGNWRHPEDKTPLDLYRRELGDELGALVSGLSPVIEPFADYLEVHSVEQHGNPNMRKVLPETRGTIYCIASVFSSTLEGEELQEVFGIPTTELNPESLRGRIKSTESGVAVLTVEGLLSGDINNFAAGDGIRLKDYLRERYGIKISVRTPHGKSIRLTQTTPLTPYAERDSLPYLRLNPLRVGTAPQQSPFRKV